MASAEVEIRGVMEARSEAMGAKDIERLMDLYALDVVYFDLVPPLRYTGAPALRARFLDWFGKWRTAIGQGISELHVDASGDLGTAFMLIRASGTLTTGQEVDYWLRTTDHLRRINGRWAISHEHVSLPVDMATRSAMLDLAP